MRCDHIGRSDDLANLCRLRIGLSIPAFGLLDRPGPGPYPLINVHPHHVVGFQIFSPNQRERGS